MVRRDKRNNALYALHRVLVEARTMATARNDIEMAQVLDWAETLPRLIAVGDRDTTEQFREHLRAIAERHPSFRHALTAFDQREEIEC